MQTALPKFLGVALLVFSTMAQPVTPKPAAATGTIAGRVTVGTTAVAGVEVLLKTSGNPTITDFLSTGPIPTATTDAEGSYQLVGIAAGSYRVIVYAPTLVSGDDDSPLTPGRTVNVREG